MKQRNAAIELYRCLLMFGICMIHAGGFYNRDYHWLSSAFCWCVDGFVVISGYFGCAFKPSKILRLAACCLACSLLACQIPMVFESGYPASLGCFIGAVRDHLFYNWFPPAYIGMLMLAPIVDAALEKVDDKRLVSVFLPMVFLTFIWSFLRSYNCAKPYVPMCEMGKILLLVAIYTIGRMYRRIEKYEWLTRRRAFIGFVVCFPFGFLKLSGFSSPFAIITAICALRIFKDMTLPKSVSTMALLAAPSMFPILCYQATPYVYAHVPDIVGAMNSYGIPIVPALFGVASLFYFGGLILDIPRRITTKLLAKWSRAICNRLDELWEKLITYGF